MLLNNTSKIFSSVVAFVVLFAFSASIMQRSHLEQLKTDETEVVDIAEVASDSDYSIGFDLSTSGIFCYCLANKQSKTNVFLKKYSFKRVHFKVPIYLVLLKILVHFS
jgi:hypothetical protein